MNREEIQQIVPHRKPMLFVDSIEMQGDECVAQYTIRPNEFFTQGHFPGNPVVPGVILCEIMAQGSLDQILFIHLYPAVPKLAAQPYAHSGHIERMFQDRAIMMVLL